MPPLISTIIFPRYLRHCLSKPIFEFVFSLYLYLSLFLSLWIIVIAVACELKWDWKHESDSFIDLSKGVGNCTYTDRGLKLWKIVLAFSLCSCLRDWEISMRKKSPLFDDIAWKFKQSFSWCNFYYCFENVSRIF